MDEMISGIETAGMQAKFVASMSAGTEALKSITASAAAITSTALFLPVRDGF